MIRHEGAQIYTINFIVLNVNKSKNEALLYMDSYVLSKHPYFLNAMQRYGFFLYLQNISAKKFGFLWFFLENNCIFLNLYINCNLHFAK